jgi:asparagine synthase (glutamine-hydrolysing)
MLKDYKIFNPKWVNRFINKFADGIPDNIGYRDNMIITFILSTQISQYWAKHPKQISLSDYNLKVKINDYEHSN